MASEQLIKELMEWDVKHFDSVDDYFLFGLGQIEEHMPELRELKNNNDPHLLAEIADVYIWAKMLLMSHEVSEETIVLRVGRFREKISQHRA